MQSPEIEQLTHIPNVHLLNQEYRVISRFPFGKQMVYTLSPVNGGEEIMIFQEKLNILLQHQKE